MDPTFTKITGRAINVAKDLYDWGIANGQIDESQLRLTVSARRIEAKKLIDSGLSQRQAAKALGVDHATINRDLAVQNAPRNGAKCTTMPIEISVSPILYVENALRKGTGFREAAQKLLARAPNTLNMSTISKLLETIKIQIEERNLLLEAITEYIQRGKS